jgi:Uma2 family endonuclease
MAGTRNAHYRIATNIVSALGSRLRDKPCEAFNSDTRVRVRMADHVRFYYPDAMVVRQPNSQADSFQDAPVVLIEVLSRKTRRIDEGEKKDAYLTIPTLAAHVLVDQESPAVVVHRRSGREFVREVFEGTEAYVPLAEAGIDLPLAEVYNGVKFSTEEADPQ